MGHAHQSTAEVINDPVMVSCTWIKMEYVEETVVGGCPNVIKTVKTVKKGFIGFINILPKSSTTEI